LSINQACKTLSISKSSYYYERKLKDDSAVVDALNKLIEKHPRNGFWLLFNRLRKQGFIWNHKRVYRVYKALGLNFKKRTKKRIPARVQHPLQDLFDPNEQWSMDFMSNKLFDGRRYRVLNIMDEFNQMFYDKKFSNKKNINEYPNIKTEYFSPKSNTYEKAIKNLIENSKEYIYIPIFYLTHKDLANELINAHNRGVEIKIILDASAARNKYSMHKSLREAGIKVKVENFGGKMHAKSIIIDDKYFVSGSMNLTKAGVIKNDENTLVLENMVLTKQYKEYFLTLWKKIPNTYLYKDPNPESFESINSCFDNIDNDFDKKIDLDDELCQNKR
jgi:putative transposase